ncbi:1119_t:CDS:2, partial [Acaulospora colombiana]
YPQSLAHIYETISVVGLEESFTEGGGFKQITLPKRVKFMTGCFDAGIDRKIKLLDYEPRAADQVPLLMNMQEDELALIKAIESGDTDLGNVKLIAIKLPLGEFFRIISNKPMACRLLEVYCKQQDLKLLTDFYYQDDRRVEMADMTISESYEQKSLEVRINNLKLALKWYQDDKEHAFEAKAIDEHIKLLQVQSQLEKELEQPFVGLSLSETLHKCITLNHSSKANKLKSDFKVPDKRFWWIKLKALVEMRGWDELDKLAKSKKSPIGYEPFVEECIKAMQQREAAKYIQKCDPAVRPGLFIKIGDFKAAGQEALLLKDIQLLSPNPSSSSPEKPNEKKHESKAKSLVKSILHGSDSVKEIENQTHSKLLARGKYVHELQSKFSIHFF